MRRAAAALLGAIALTTAAASAACPFRNTVPLKSLSAGFQAWKSVTAAMAECGNVTAALDQEFAAKLPQALAAKPAAPSSERPEGLDGSGRGGSEWLPSDAGCNRVTVGRRRECAPEATVASLRRRARRGARRAAKRRHKRGCRD